MNAVKRKARAKAKAHFNRVRRNGPEVRVDVNDFETKVLAAVDKLWEEKSLVKQYVKENEIEQN